MFKKATKMKLRFETTQGVLSVEDLWDLPLTKLNSIAKGLNNKIKSFGEDSFIEESKVPLDLTMKFEIVLEVISDKQEENKARKEAQERAQKRKKLEELIYIKQNEELAEKSVEELKKELENI